MVGETQVVIDFNEQVWETGRAHLLGQPSFQVDQPCLSRGVQRRALDRVDARTRATLRHGSGGDRKLAFYPEGRKCRRPTARRLIDLFDDVQHHSLRAGRRPPVVFKTELSRLQRRLLRLLGMTNVYDA